MNKISALSAERWAGNKGSRPERTSLKLDAELPPRRIRMYTYKCARVDWTEEEGFPECIRRLSNGKTRPQRPNDRPHISRFFTCHGTPNSWPYFLSNGRWKFLGRIPLSASIRSMQRSAARCDPFLLEPIQLGNKPASWDLSCYARTENRASRSFSHLKLSVDFERFDPSLSNFN